MKQDIALRLLSNIMRWDTDRAREEFAWLRLISQLKYDGYGDYVAGARFVESLADWLQQFDQAEREIAYDFVRHHVVYIGAGEIQHLIELVYPEIIQPRLISAVATRLNIPTFKIWSRQDAKELYQLLLRKTIFLGLSDGARIDAFRRINAGIISNEQIVVATQIDDAKWQSLLEALRRDTQDTSARFAFVYLLDDFVATGTTLLRFREATSKWEGKLMRFWDNVGKSVRSYFDKDWVLCVHHYIATYRATMAVIDRNAEVLKERGDGQWFPRVEFSHGMVLQPDLCIDDQRHARFMQLIAKYYDPVIETAHTELGGTDVRLGFGKCALPLVLEHNTPNNSIALLWAETPGSNDCHPMRPLFRRRQRHS